MRLNIGSKSWNEPDLHSLNKSGSSINNVEKFAAC